MGNKKYHREMNLLKITDEGKFDFSNIDFDEVQKKEWEDFGDFLNQLCSEAYIAGLDDGLVVSEGGQSI